MTIDPSASIHASAIIADGARIGADVSIGAYCVIGPDVSIGPGTELKSHVSIDGHTRIGARNTIFPFASLGQQPQDLKFRGERTLLEIGDGNAIREYVTMNPGTEGGGGVTRVGDECLFMNHVHVGHDCIVGSRVIFANAATLGGHVVVGDGAVLGGLSAVHQRCRIGEGAMIGGLAGVVADVIPFGTVMGERAKLQGLNLLGLKRRGVDKAQISALRAAYAALFAPEGTLRERSDAVTEQYGDHPLVQQILAFIAEDTARRLTTPD